MREDLTEGPSSDFDDFELEEMGGSGFERFGGSRFSIESAGLRFGGVGPPEDVTEELGFAVADALAEPIEESDDDDDDFESDDFTLTLAAPFETDGVDIADCDGLVGPDGADGDGDGDDDATIDFEDGAGCGDGATDTEDVNVDPAPAPAPDAEEIVWSSAASEWVVVSGGTAESWFDSASASPDDTVAVEDAAVAFVLGRLATGGGASSSSIVDETRVSAADSSSMTLR